METVPAGSLKTQSSFADVQLTRLRLSSTVIVWTSQSSKVLEETWGNRQRCTPSTPCTPVYKTHQNMGCVFREL